MISGLYLFTLMYNCIAANILQTDKAIPKYFTTFQRVPLGILTPKYSIICPSFSILFPASWM
jgi:hypothetical protein